MKISHRLSVIPLALVMIFMATSVIAEKKKTDYVPVSWNQLIPADYDFEALENEVISRYDLETLEDDSPEAQTLIAKLQALQDKAPVTHEYDGIQVKIPGFVVPLDFEDEKIFSFLLVPYFGACIHTPPPPPNQIVYVELEESIELDNTYEPIYVNGLMRVERQESELGAAGYVLYGHSIAPYL